jgi:lysophospholipase L1-like esterase
MPKISNILLFLGTVVVCALGLELGFRAYSDVPILRFIDWRQAHRASIEQAGVAIYDPRLGWTMRDGYASASMNLIEQGIRKNQPSDTEIRTGGVLVVGDSFTAGSQVNDDGTWPAQLEKRLGTPVINAGIGGYGIDQMVLRAEQLLPIVRPKILIVGTQDQGILRVKFSSYGRPKPYFSVEAGALLAHNDPVPRYTIDPDRESPLLRIMGYSYIADRIMGIYEPDDWYTQDGQHFIEAPVDDVAVSCRLLERLRQDADGYGARPLMVMQYGGPLRLMSAPPPFAEKVMQCARAAGIDVVDEFEPLHGIAEHDIDEFKKLYVMVDDPAQPYGHMSVLGNRQIAELIAAALREPPAQRIDQAAMQRGTPSAPTVSGR